MLFSQINPFVRYARYLKLDRSSRYDEVIAPDARLFYAIGGYGKIKVGHMTYEMAPHALLLIHSGIPYHIETPLDFADYIAINFDHTRTAAHLNIPIKPESKVNFKESMRTDPRQFEDATPLSGVLYLREIDSIHKNLVRLLGEYTRQLLYHSEKCGHLLAECIADCLRCQQIGQAPNATESSHAVISYVQKHYAEEITNQIVAKAFGYHPNYISALIKRMTGMPLHRYVLHLRLMRAAGLLENTGMSVGEVALAAGFCDIAYFSAYFKKHFGTPPSKYRMG
ncbi:MAG: helix-turn-helix transcriptional regulator [Ruminococcaceae bacterium]|nr:helix-turn-helix transcriptional regulator [Oscillospiraceae bacterium]